MKTALSILRWGDLVGKLSCLIGLSKQKRKARVQIKACQNAGEVFPHTLLSGCGGTGKTAFARALGFELGYHFIETHGRAFKKREQLFEALIHYSAEAQRIGKPLLFFLDEVHGLNLNLQEALYSVMKEWWIPTDRGKQYLSPFVLVAATTRIDKLDANSFVTRFPNNWEISRYGLQDMMEIVAYEFDKLGLTYSVLVLEDIAQRCLGIPRIAVTLSRKVRTTVIAAGAEVITLSHTRRTFEDEEVDELGLQPVHRKYLQILDASRADGKLRAIGILAIAAKMRQHEDMVRGSVEPILLELSLVSPTPRGRILTESGEDYLSQFSNINAGDPIGFSESSIRRNQLCHTKT